MLSNGKLGFVYDGEWVNDSKEGKGTCIFFDGSKFEGYWAEDKPNGYGVFYYANGAKVEGKWNLGVREGKFTYLNQPSAVYCEDTQCLMEKDPSVE